MRIDVLTLFPEMFQSVLSASILHRAASARPDPSEPDHAGEIRPPAVSYHLHDIREFTASRHGKVDKPPYGGGPGMVMQCQPVWDAVQAVQSQEPERPAHRVLMTPQGSPLRQPTVERLACEDRLLILAGHYEGLDQRVIDRMHEEGGLEEISLGDFVLSGGEIAAMALIDAVVRLQPGVLGDARSAEDESFSASLEGGLDYPHYTRPPVWAGREVPQVLRSGHHAQIAAWRAEQSRKATRERRPDLDRQ